MENFAHPISRNLRDRAMSLPETTEGTSCVNRAFRVRKKNFLFVGEKGDKIRVMLKLKDSLQQAIDLGDSRIEVGTGGWVTMRFVADNALDEAMLLDWLAESFCVLGPKTLARQVASGDQSKGQ